jgi:hypothetical protein
MILLKTPLIPGEIAKKYNVIPLAVSDGSLMIAMEQPGISR